MLSYLKYVIDLVDHNHFYKVYLGADISLFDNCSWKAYKRNMEGEGK